MSLEDKARAWLEQDPDPDTRDELRAILEAQDGSQLRDRFSDWLQFGTAGLRGLLGAGPNRMNRVTVIRATAGLCAWLKQQVPDVSERGVCIGRDGRIKSDLFAQDVAAVVAGAGIPVYWFDQLVPTPVLGFAVQHLNAAAGVMITASHNPPAYNGYKVYWGNGAQIIPPHDSGIAKEISRAEGVPNIPQLSVPESVSQGLHRNADDLIDVYVGKMAALASSTPSDTKRSIRIAYTALHGVGEGVLRAVFERAGFTTLQSVAAQAEPDGTFPTVSFPNPEEPGAVDAVLALAQEQNADIAIANDPDADRLAVSVRHRGTYVPLSGNDIGILLADFCLTRFTGQNPLVLSTVVSSPLLGSVAKAHKARFAQTLTGHKWIHNRAIELESEGYAFVFGYEEALGYAATTHVRDKDGISAAVLIAELAAMTKQNGTTLIDVRDRIASEHGMVVNRQWSVRFEGTSARAEMAVWMDGFRSNPPSTLGGIDVLSVHDLKHQTRTGPGGKTEDATLPPSDVLLLELDGGHNVMVRPSGTEPKLKFYTYARVTVDDNVNIEAARRDGDSILERVAAELDGLIASR